MAMNSLQPARSAHGTSSVNLARAMAAAQAAKKESAPEEMRTSITSMGNPEQNQFSPETQQQFLTPQVNTEAQDYQVLFDDHEQQRVIQIEQTRQQIAQLISQLPDTSTRIQTEITLIEESTYESTPSVGKQSYLDIVLLSVREEVTRSASWRAIHSQKKQQQGAGLFGTKTIHDRMNDERRNTDDAA